MGKKKKQKLAERDPETRKQTFVRPKVKTEWFDELDVQIPDHLKDEVNRLEESAQVQTKNSQNQEQLAEAYENNADAVSDNKLENQELMREHEKARIGRRMTHTDFLTRLRQAGIKAWYNTEPFQGLIGLRAEIPGREQLGLKFICGVQMGWMAEYDALHYDEYGNALNRKRVGWRTVILQLIAKGVLTEVQAHEIYGRPIEGVASVIYREKLWQFRNARARGEEVAI